MDGAEFGAFIAKVVVTVWDKAPMAVAIVLPTLLALYPLLRAQAAKKPDDAPKADDKLDRLLTAVTSLADRLASLETKGAERTNALAIQIARIEGRLDAEK